MTGVGGARAKAIQDGRWITLDCEQEQFLDDGTFVLKWQLHWVSGWAPEHGEYRAVDPDIINWRNEMSAGDGSWFDIEEYAMVPLQARQ